MLYNWKVGLYHKTINQDTKKEEYIFEKEFDCNMQPINADEGVEGFDRYKGLKMYFEINEVKMGDKILFSGVEYFVRYVEIWNGLRRKPNKAYIYMEG